ncbi:hypothetical protein JR316_0001701 [Psilocybe cubensis]|uniref:Uncharacterized protein n=1 Tax=Psilocybe cubensis TaxID=181762 RepID=A0ACB8HAU5_PSICU|nr:hypothetical protein JR316_0001701 [Psilocybe cubensis]KAH9484799.1 hypothetical protein JR316_0001701 [Psilocybe cubensis]
MTKKKLALGFRPIDPKKSLATKPISKFSSYHIKDEYGQFNQEQEHQRPSAYISKYITVASKTTSLTYESEDVPYYSRNTGKPLYTLNDDVTNLIMEIAMDDYSHLPPGYRKPGNIYLSSICAKWRRTIHGIPLFWTKVSVPLSPKTFNTMECLLRDWLLRSGTILPLDIHIYSKDRVQLKLPITFYDLLLQSSDRLASFYCDEFIQLWPSNIHVSSQLYFSHAKSLQKLSLSPGTSIDLLGIYWANIHEFEWGVFTVNEVMEDIHLLTHLRTLRIRLISKGIFRSTDVHAKKPDIDLQWLTCLQITGDSSSLAIILASITTPALISLAIELDSPGDSTWCIALVNLENRAKGIKTLREFTLSNANITEFELIVILMPLTSLITFNLQRPDFIVSDLLIKALAPLGCSFTTYLLQNLQNFTCTDALIAFNPTDVVDMMYRRHDWKTTKNHLQFPDIASPIPITDIQPITKFITTFINRDCGTNNDFNKYRSRYNIRTHIQQLKEKGMTMDIRKESKT